MTLKGFEKLYIGKQFVIDLLMPNELKDIFFARFYGKGPICDDKNGEPSEVWSGLSYNHMNIKLAAPRQVHGTEIIQAVDECSLPIRTDADGVFIKKGAECFGSLRFADCAPVVMAGAEPEPWLLLLHSGFVGTVKNIVACGVEKVHSELGAIHAQNAWAWVGPGICGDCYCRKLRGDESTTNALKVFSPNNYKICDESVFFDIRAQIYGQLLACGLKAENVFMYDKCTHCGGEPLYSYRGGDAHDRIFLLAGDATKQ